MTDPYDWSEPAHLTVPGHPMPQGSMACVCIKGRGQLIRGKGASRAAFTKWRRDVTAAATLWQTTHFAEPLDAPCRLRLTFRLPRPVSVKRQWPSMRPDIDKLVRAVCDSLTKTLYVDDSRVVELVARKVYCSPEQPTPGVSITLERL